jgi:hypothetical protein
MRQRRAALVSKAEVATRSEDDGSSHGRRCAGIHSAISTQDVQIQRLGATPRRRPVACRAYVRKRTEFNACMAYLGLTNLLLLARNTLAHAPRNLARANANWVSYFRFRHKTKEKCVMGKYVIAWFLGVPAGVLILVYVFFHLF